MLRLSTYLSLLLLLTTVAAFAQRAAQFSMLKESFQNYVIPAPNLRQLEAEDAKRDQQKDIPWRFAQQMPVDIEADRSWFEPDAEGLHSNMFLIDNTKRAKSLGLFFDRFELAEGAEVFVWNDSDTLGPFTASDASPMRQLRTNPLLGHWLELVIFEPGNRGPAKSNVHISEVAYGYRSLSQIARDLGDAGACHINTSCPEADSLRDPVNSVAMIIVGGTGVCTGALINNTCNDETPYLLTANHCLDGTEDTWIFRFNWESPTCTPTANGPTNHTIMGANVRAASANSDFALLELSEPIPEAWNPHWAGWNRSTNAPDSVFTVHHPSGDIKKISFDNDATVAASFGGANVWRVIDWDLGSTEGGSSGAPLFNKQGRIVGQLAGGSADCSNSLDDNYGRFDISWDFNTPNNQQLEHWLDGCATGATTINGWPPTPTFALDASAHGIRNIPADVCGDSIVPWLVIRNSGLDTLTSLTVDYQLNAGPVSSVSWTGQLASTEKDTIVLPGMPVLPGNHTLTFLTTSPNGAADQDASNDQRAFTFSVDTSGAPIQFVLQTDDFGSETVWNVRDSSGSILFGGGPYVNTPGGQLVEQEMCLAPGCYRFTINDSFGDGMNGSGSGGQLDGNYGFINQWGDTLAQLTTANFGFIDRADFCASTNCSTGLPTLDFSSNPAICFNTNTGEVFVAVTGGTAPYMYQWNDSDQQTGSSADDLAAGTYSVIVSDSLGCTVTGSVQVTEPDTSLLIFGTVTDASDLNNDGAIDITIGGGWPPYILQWSNDTNSTFNPELAKGFYTVTVSDAEGCIDSATFFVDGPFSVAENVARQAYSIFPNPASQQLSVKTQLQSADATITLYDALGKAVLRDQLNASNQFSATLNLHGLRPGLYLLAASSNNYVLHERVLIVR